MARPKEFDDLPSLEDDDDDDLTPVNRRRDADDDDDDEGGQPVRRGKGKEEEDDPFSDLIDLEEKDKRFAEEDDDYRENRSDGRRKSRKELQEEVFFFDEDEDGSGGDLDDFDENKPDKKKHNRLQREMRAKIEARKAANNAIAIINELEGTIAEIAKMEMKTRRDAATMMKNFAAADLRDAERRLAKAKEEGDTDEIVALTQRINDARSGLEKANISISNLPDEKIEGFTYKHKNKPKAQQLGRGADWTDANSDWFNNANNKAERAAALAIDRELLDKGSDPESPEHYMKLTKALAVKFPSLKVYTDDGRLAQVGRKRGGSTGKRDIAASSRRNASGRTSMEGSRERITGEEHRFLSGFGIDFSDPDHKKEFLANRVRER